MSAPTSGLSNVREQDAERNWTENRGLQKQNHQNGRSSQHYHRGAPDTRAINLFHFSR
jgi:hypothetical protein